MTDERKSAVWPIVVLALCLAVPLAAYVAGYFLLGDAVSAFPDNDKHRFYSSRWEARIFEPAARIESLVIGRRVVTAADD